MKQTKPTMFFEIVRIFPIMGGGQGVVLKDARSIKKEHYVADANDVSNPRVGAFIEIPCRTKGDAVLIPNQLILVWAGDLQRRGADMMKGMIALAEASKMIRRQYLTYLYAGPLHASRQPAADAEMVDGRVKKSFDPKDVFAHPTLRMLESLHDLIQPVKLHDALVENNYQYNRPTIYTRFRDDPEDVSYKTPRALNYYPLEKMVRVAYALGGVPDDIEVRVKEDKVEKIKAYPVMVNIVRTFTNEGWTSLRDMAYNEPPLRAFIKMFYDNGYGRPEVSEHLK